MGPASEIVHVIEKLFNYIFQKSFCKWLLGLKSNSPLAKEYSTRKSPFSGILESFENARLNNPKYINFSLFRRIHFVWHFERNKMNFQSSNWYHTYNIILTLKDALFSPSTVFTQCYSTIRTKFYNLQTCAS